MLDETWPKITYISKNCIHGICFLDACHLQSLQQDKIGTFPDTLKNIVYVPKNMNKLGLRWVNNSHRYTFIFTSSLSTTKIVKENSSFFNLQV